MTLKDFSARFWARLTRKYRMVVIDHESLSQNRQWIVRPIGMMILGAASLAAVVALTVTLLIFTPLRKAIPGYPDPKKMSEARDLRALADTLEAKLKQQENYINSLRAIERFELQNDSDIAALPTYHSDIVPSSKAFPRGDDQPPIQTQDEPEHGQVAEGGSPQMAKARQPGNKVVMNLIPPVDGIIVGKFDPEDKSDSHYGIDMVADESSLIRSVADGVVIFSEYSNATGYVIGISHTDYNLISFYKHNSRVFKKVGSYVFSGEAIAVIGNSGKNTSGPHLHFEMWYENSPVNPEDYIIFK